MNINSLTNKKINTYETTKTKQLKIKETNRDVYFMINSTCLRKGSQIEHDTVNSKQKEQLYSTIFPTEES